ncbi:hypothetical protein AB6M97_08960 [Streptococcus hillyeri]|uniref:hypothetical protein n=1 Tax=Streptococcus hillyeri TaxID=2282420 RepID=UPI0034E27594
MEDVITISKSELQELIAREIANRTCKTRRDFREVMIDHSDLEGVNRLYPDIYNKMHLPFYNSFTNDTMPLNETGRISDNIGSTSSIYSTTRHLNRVKNAYYHSKSSLYTSNIHEALKALALALHGATLIKELDDEEFREALETYNDFKQFFLERYSVRLSKLQQILRQK